MLVWIVEYVGVVRIISRETGAQVGPDFESVEAAKAYCWANNWRVVND